MGWESGPVLGGRLGAPSWVTCPSPRAAGPQRVWALAGSFLTDQVGPSWLWWDGMWWDMMGRDAQPGAYPTSHLLGPSATGVGRIWWVWFISSVAYLKCGLSAVRFIRTRLGMGRAKCWWYQGKGIVSMAALRCLCNCGANPKWSRTFTSSPNFNMKPHPVHLSLYF